MAEEGDLSLKDFVLTYTLPQLAKVTQGHCSDSDCDDADFSTNDVIKVSQTSFTLSVNFIFALKCVFLWIAFHDRCSLFRRL